MGRSGCLVISIPCPLQLDVFSWAKRRNIFIAFFILGLFFSVVLSFISSSTSVLESTAASHHGDVHITIIIIIFTVNNIIVIVTMFFSWYT